MTDFDVYNLIVGRFFGKFPIKTNIGQEVSIEPNFIKVKFPRRMTLTFKYGHYGCDEDINVRLFFESDFDVLDKDDNLSELVSRDFRETEVDHCPFKRLVNELIFAPGDELNLSLFLEGVIKRDELTTDKLSEFVHYILHPTPFFLRLLKLADGNVEDYQDRIIPINEDDYYNGYLGDDDEDDEYYEDDEYDGKYYERSNNYLND